MKDILKYLRQIGGFTQEDAAKMLGVSRQSYNKYEKGTVLPSDSLIAKIAEVYGVDEAFVRANKIPQIPSSAVEYKIDSCENIPAVASLEGNFEETLQKKSYDAYFDGNTVRVIGEVNFYEGQRFKLFPIDDEKKEELSWIALQDVLLSHNPLAIPSDKDPFYREMLNESVEKKI